MVRRLGTWCLWSRRWDAWLDRVTSRCGMLSEARRRAVTFWIGLPLRWMARSTFLRAALRRANDAACRLDVVHVHETGWLAGLGSQLAADWGVPVICKVRNTPALDVIGYDVPMRRHWDALRRQVHFVALHDQLSEELRAHRVPESHISLIPNGTDVPAQLSSEARDPNHVLYVGNFSQGALHKGFDVLIAAWARIQEQAPQARLMLVGGGDPRPWEDMAVASNCRSSMEFVGYVSDVGPLYERASVFIFPSRHEGMSNALLEAQSHGLPAVASDIPANRAVVDPGETGILVPVDDPGNLAAATLQLLNDHEERERLGRNAHARMRTLFDRTVIARTMLQLYHREKERVSA